MRKIIHQLHLWLGLLSSILLFIVCFSGTVLVFGHEIESWFKPYSSNLVVDSNQNLLSLETLVKNVEESSKGKVAGLTILSSVQAPYQFNVKQNPEDRRGKPYIINPYTGEVLNNPNERSGFFMFFFRLHRWLLLEDTVGRPIVGVATIIYSFLLLSGLFLWWPKNRHHFKNSLKIKLNGSIKRLNHDLHNTLGFYALPLLLVMSLTGLFWSFEWYRNLGSTVLNTKVFDRGGRPSEVRGSGEKLSYQQLLDLIHLELPYSGKTMIMLPGNPKQALVAVKTPDHFMAVQGSDKLEINPYTGEVLKKDLFSGKSFGAKISSLIKPLHTGEVMGLFSKIIYFIVCFIGTTLPLTGFFIWFNKRRKHV